jgi:hypothetical protein
MHRQLLEPFMCPISMSLPIDPVLAEDGFIYERACLHDHLLQRQKSPMTNLPMGNVFLSANHVTRFLKTMVDQ